MNKKGGVCREDVGMAMVELIEGRMIYNERQGGVGQGRAQLQRSGIGVTEASGYYRTSSGEELIGSLADGARGSSPSLEYLGLASLPLTNRVSSDEIFTTMVSHAQDQCLHLRQGLESEFNPHRYGIDISDGNRHMPASAEDSCTKDKQIKSKNRCGQKTTQNRTINTSQTMPWLQCTGPMIHNHSSEFCKKYAALPEIHINQIPASPQRLLVPRTENFQEVVSSGPLTLSLANGTGNINPSSLQTLQETAQIHPIALGDPVSTAVNLLKVGLECKKKTVNMQREASYIGFNAGEPIGLRGESWMHGKDLIDHKQATVSSMQSPSNSSDGGSVLSASLVNAGPSNCAQTVHTHENGMKQAACVPTTVQQLLKRQMINSNEPLPNTSGPGSNNPKPENFQKRPLRKRPDQFTRVTSLMSSGRPGVSVDREDATKRRRLERQRKMAEAKVRSSASPVIPDLQATLKRCDALEKEVRSLKLNLSFMNRKDSEQTKQIEELQKQKADLMEGNDRLLQELHQITFPP